MIKISKFIRNLSLIVLVVVFIIAFSNSYSSFNIDNLAFVVAIGIDKGKNNNLKFSFQFSNSSEISENGESKTVPTFINTVETSSIDNAINIMNAYIGKQLNLSHCKIIVFSEKVAFNGIEKEIYSLINNVQIRPSTNLVISKCDAYTYIENSKPSLENLTSKYYEIFPTSGKYTGFTFDATIGDFFNNLVSQNAQAYAILGGLSNLNIDLSNTNLISENSYIKSNNTPISGKRGSENIGLAVFKDGFLIGELNSMETICFSVIKNKVDSFLITVEDPLTTGNTIDIYIYPKTDAKANVKIINGNPYIEFSSKFEGKIASMQADSDYLSTEVLDIISDRVNSYLESIFYNYLYKTSLEFESDINGFGRFALSNFSVLKEFEEYNWLSNYKSSIFKLDFKTKIQSGMLLTKT